MATPSNRSARAVSNVNAQYGRGFPNHSRLESAALFLCQIETINLNFCDLMFIRFLFKDSQVLCYKKFVKNF